MTSTWETIEKERDNGETVKMQAPVIVSASRSTDIPAFYADWFFERLKRGYSAWTNPFNGKQSYISYDKTRFIVFWSKNPRCLLTYKDELKKRGIHCYIQYSLNDYENDGLEKNVRPLAERIETFKLLVDAFGKGSVVWRFDPLVLTKDISIEDLIAKIDNIGSELYGYTEKLVFSFADIISYRKVQNNLKTNNIDYVDWSLEMMQEFASKLVELNKKWGYKLATCGEAASFEGIEHNHCVDDELIIRLAYNDKPLMKFLGVEIIDLNNQVVEDLFADYIEVDIPADAIALGNGLFAVKHKNNKDKGQRLHCGCMVSKDIGEYNTCIHKCEYCYATASKQLAEINYRQHLRNPFSETITGR